MLQRYSFIKTHAANDLHLEILKFLKNIKSVKETDDFNPKVHLPDALLKKSKKSKGKFNTYCKAYFDKYKKLKIKKEIVDDAIFCMNDLTNLLNGTGRRYTINDLPYSIRKEAKDLFIYLYETPLSSVIKSSKHYKQFYNNLESNACAFCGLDYLEDPDQRKQDYDHFLPKSIYPFCAINLKNLIPCCCRCNQIYKKEKDPLIYRGARCPTVTPYVQSFSIKVNFDGSILPTSQNREGNWKVSFKPKRVEVENWNNVYEIGDRIIRNHLTGGRFTKYETLIQDFVRSQEGRKDFSKTDVRSALKQHANNKFGKPKFEDKRYVYYSLFTWLSKNLSESKVMALQLQLNSKT